MTSLNKLKSHHGSALVVTMLLVSVLLTAALILLQRIVPYAKSVRSMHDASQAYYTARGEVELGRLGFFYRGGGSLQQQALLRIPSLFGLLSQTGDTLIGSAPFISETKRGNLETTTTDLRLKTLDQTDIADGIRTEKLGLPVLNSQSHLNRDHIVISTIPQAPLRIKLFEKDSTPKRFGTSKKNADYHTLYSRNAGGLRFDLRGVNTVSIDSLLIKSVTTMLANTILTVKMQYFLGGANDPVKTFTRDYVLTTGVDLNLKTNTDFGNIQSITSSGGVASEPATLFGNFLGSNNCSSANICSISLILSGPTESIDFRIISNVAIPDLNAVVIGDGLSTNKLYYQRIIDLIPTPQDI